MEEKLHNPTAAIHSYALSLAFREDSGVRQRLLTQVANSAPRASLAISNAREELSKLRVSQLKNPYATKASAEFFLLLAPGRIEDVKFVSGSEKLKDKARLTSLLKLSAEFPDDGPTRVLRRGLLSCSVVTSSCQFVLYDLADVKSIE